MLTLDSILRTTRQMSAFGERGTSGALDHLPSRVQGPGERRRSRVRQEASDDSGKPARRWDNELKIFVAD